MSRSTRNLRRADKRRATSWLAARAKAPAPTGFDLGQAQLTDIESLHLDMTDSVLTVSLQLPVHGGEGYAVYEEELDFDNQLPGYLCDAARKFSGAALRAIKERVVTQQELPCRTCIGACCGVRLDTIRVTAADVERLEAAGIEVPRAVELHEDGVDFAGYVGHLRLVTDEAGKTRCPFLEPWGCSVYEHRPLICREFSPWTCDMYEQDEAKASGEVKLGRPPQERQP